MERRELHFLKYRLHGKLYLEFYKTLKKLNIAFLTQHTDESYYISKYKEYGKIYLDFLYDAIELKLHEIVDMKGFREHQDACILKWVYMDSDRDRRSENN